MSKGRRSRVAVVMTGLVALALPAAVPSAVMRESGPAVTSGGPLPSFAAEGDNLIRLHAGAFDPLVEPPPAGAAIPHVAVSDLPSGVAQYWLVQVRDGRFAAALAAIADAGASVAGFVPDGAYVVRATPAQRNALAASTAVRWTAYYQPAWRLPASLLDVAGQRTYRVYLFPSDPNLGGAAEALDSIAGVRIVERSGRVVDLEATALELAAIASVRAVEWVSLKPRAVPLNANARWVNDTGVRDLYAATAPGRLTGAGQTAAVADSGVNYTYDLNGRAHVAFRDCDASGVCKQAIYTQRQPGRHPGQLEDVVDNATGHRKMVAYFDLGKAGPNMYDISSHGTHTAGSVAGDASEHGAYDGDDGLAPGAGLVHQNIADQNGALSGLPADNYLLFRQAYRPRDPASVPTMTGLFAEAAERANYRPAEDARTHNNSYGLFLASADPFGDAANMDRFVWDHEDMVIVISAGNSGPATITIGSPSVGKNDFTSGASANGRQPMVSIDSMASFSSHGPTLDRRFGVDLATPGQIVVSAKGGTTDGYHTAQGTSMSAPVLTGLATLVRQYFWDGYGPAGGKGFPDGVAGPAGQHNPSAALVKAALVNGAERMRGFYTGDDGTVRAQDGQWPSAGQGFGRVNLDNSLYFAGDPANNWYRDVWRHDTEAFGATVGVPLVRTYELDVAAGQPLDVTLAWTDAPNALPAGTPALVNDLNLSVVGPNGSVYLGNNMNSRGNPGVDVAETLPGAAAPDALNNVERVRIAAPAAGRYTVTVVGARVARPNQGFALAASGLVSAPGDSFAAGPARQADAPGSPAISGLTIEATSADTAKIRFTTSEPTTATAVVGGTTFVDSYNVGSGGFPGLNEATVETSAAYGDRPMVGTAHEILVTGLAAGATQDVTVTVRDLAGNEAGETRSHRSPTAVLQADAADIGQLTSTTGAAGWRTGTQLYAGAGLLGAFMFRVPPGSVDPARVVGAAVELVTAHNWTVPYTEDPVYRVDLLPESLEAAWGTQDYATIDGAASTARVHPETGHRRGAYQRYAFTYTCQNLAALRATLANGNAAFRWTATELVGGGVFSGDFGFNRRSRGPDLRPRLVLFTQGETGYPDGRACDASAPAPAIRQLGIRKGTTANSVTVTWETDVDSTSVVLFRRQGTAAWTQVGTPTLTKIHQVQVLGLDPSVDYEFVVRSAACNGATTTDTNGGAGYDFFFPPAVTDPGPATPVASFGFDTGDQGWTATNEGGTLTSWRLAPTGSSGSALAWRLQPYADQTEASVTSPSIPVPGARVTVDFDVVHDTEDTFDFLYVEYSGDGGTSWRRAGAFDGLNRNHPGFDPASVSFNHPNPGGPVRVRFRFESDLLISAPFTGVAFDGVRIGSHPNALTETTLGPVPPPSAGATGLTAPPTRPSPTAADIAAGTGMCAVPDLRPTGVTYTTRKVKGADQVTFHVTVANDGAAAANDVGVRFTVDGAQLGSVKTIASLAAGETVTVDSDVWDAKHAATGDHSVTVAVDPGNAVDELDETNNTASGTVSVEGNKVRNGSFETSSSGSAPDAWSPSGSTSYAEGGSDGSRSVTAGPGGSWTSEPVAVDPGSAYELFVDTSGAAALVLVEQLDANGSVLASLSLPTLASIGSFTTATTTVTAASAATQLRVVLVGGLTAPTTFDDVRLYER